MKNPTRIYWMHVLTPLHVGAGRGVEFVDLPIAREKITHWPVVPGSAVKGVLRDYFGRNGTEESLVEAAFGPEPKSAEQNDFAGALVLTDARIALLPVRSLYGTFAYATSPLALRRLQRDLEAAGEEENPAIPSVPEDKVLVSSGSRLLLDGRLYLEDLDFGAKPGAADEWAAFLGRRIFAQDWLQTFRERFAILPDDAFDFLCETGTEVNARVRIDDEKGTVAQGGLWYEESLPAESVLAGLVWCDRVFAGNGVTPAQIVETFTRQPIHCQIGGKATVGRGQVACRFSGEMKK